jgi:hypothetical protein
MNATPVPGSAVQRNLDGFFSFLGITGAAIPILLCIAYATRQRRDEHFESSQFADGSLMAQTTQPVSPFVAEMFCCAINPR